VSGIEVALRQPAGADDILLAEADRFEPWVALALVAALARPADGGAVDWAGVTLTDLDATLLAIRRMVLGNRVESSARCGTGDDPGQVGATGAAGATGAVGTAGCGARIDLGFWITDYLEQHRPHIPRGVTRCDDPAWFQIDGIDGGIDGIAVRFRPPSNADLAAIAAEPDGERELARRCIEPGEVPARLRRRIERAMEAIAPSLYGELEGTCPECGATVAITFDPQRYVVDELRQRAAFVFEEVHLIAERYRWSEDAILTMPRARRARYAELIHETRSGG
jgi:hypothetical protein